MGRLYSLDLIKARGDNPLSREYSVPKRQVPARVALPGQAPAEVSLFLNECAATHEGRERPSDLLNGSLPFIPALNPAGEVVLLHRDNLMFVTVAAGDESEDDRLQDGTEVSIDATVTMIRVVLEGGATVRGTVTYVMPKSQRRLQDYLNTDQQFLALREDDVVHLVNKRRVSLVSIE
ncbi:MAG TPA: hypothetical protein VFG76_03125 [Candidatus Polarisedimenticolia bacterium]|nr:hypothetical protein [Candidatus Polarisedimenticolia bacterium]